MMGKLQKIANSTLMSSSRGLVLFRWMIGEGPPLAVTSWTQSPSVK